MTSLPRRRPLAATAAAAGLALAVLVPAQGVDVAAAAPPAPVVADDFARTVAGGLGTADAGGAWSVSGPAADFSVGGGTARLRLSTAGRGTSAHLAGVSTATSDASVALGLDEATTGGGAYVSLVGRRLDARTDYRVKLRFLADASVSASLVRVSGGVQTTLASAVPAGVRHAPGKLVRARLRLTGTGATALTAKVWQAGTPEPTAWSLTAQDATPALQRAGSPGLEAYLSASSTTAPLTVLVDGLRTRTADPAAGGVVTSADTRAPETTLSAAGPGQGSVQTATSASFGYRADEAATFQCRTDTAAWTPCAASGTGTGALPLGVHTFGVRAVDAAGNVDPTPAQRTWTVVPASPGLVEPGPDNTGVPAGTVLTPHHGDLVIRTPGARYDALDIHGFVRIEAPGVVITRSIIRGGTATGNVGLVTNYDRAATGFVLEDSELRPEFPSVWLDGAKGANFTLRRVESVGTVDNVKVHGDDVRVESSWLHASRHYASDPNQGGGPTHNDGVQVLGGKNIRIIGNTISDAHNAGLQVTQDVSATTDLQFNQNWADGGMCVVNLAHKKLASMSGITVNGNRFGRSTRVLDCSVLSSTMTTLVADANVWADDGSPVRIRRNG